MNDRPADRGGDTAAPWPFASRDHRTFTARCDDGIRELPKIHIDTAVHGSGPYVHGTTTIDAPRSWRAVRLAVRTLAVDASGSVLGLSEERSFVVGGFRRWLNPAPCTLRWSAAMLADDLDGLERLDVIHYVPVRGAIAERLLEAFDSQGHATRRETL
jgi:hypothetical protein